MMKTLTKGHLSCLSSAFRYTPAAHTNVADTLARIAREIKARDSQERIESLPVAQRPPFARETMRYLNLVPESGRVSKGEPRRDRLAAE